MLCFVVHFYKDVPLTLRLLKQLREHYQPFVADIIVIGDGVHNDALEKLSSTLVYRYLALERFKTIEHGGKWTQRYLEAFLVHSNAGICIKLDPDSFVSRMFEFYPIQDVFGTINNQWSLPFIRGGCIGFWRGTAKRIVKSELLLKPEFKSEIYAYQRYFNFRWEGEEKTDEWLSLQDRIVGVVCKRLNLSLTDWREVDIQFRDYIPRNLNNRYAVIHPVPFDD
jgi:hypothetical protein